ncbi:MAG TPA: hypothetical protein DCK95_01375 [Anaerolineaceae bacterium]|nr:hypothetical protein [Anaerolineaceae bacterium]
MNEQKIKIGVQQRVLPSYRIPFFDMLADAFDGKVSVFYGLPRSHEMLQANVTPERAQSTRGKNRHIFSGCFYLCWQVGLMNWLHTWDPDVLIMEANPRYPNSRHALRWMKHRQRKVIGWGLGSSPAQDGFGKIRVHSRRNFIRHFDALITYSELGAQQYAELGFPIERIFVAPNAVAAKPVAEAPQRSMNYEQNRPQILFVGRLQERKRVDLLLKAAALLPSEMQPMLHIVGDGPARGALQLLAQTEKVDAKFYGAVHGAELATLFKKADLFVLPGTGGLAVQEAMSYALPVIVGEADGTQSDLVRSSNRWVLHENIAAELAKIMLHALGNIPELRRMGNASYEIVSTDVNLENMVSAFEKVIIMLLKDSHA